METPQATPVLQQSMMVSSIHHLQRALQGITKNASANL
jgi:hypothetical protein